MTSNRTWQKIEVNSPFYAKFSLWMRNASYSDYSIYRCICYLQSPLVKEIIKDTAGVKTIVEIKDINLIGIIRRRICVQEQDIRLHHVYSSAVGRYIKFLQTSTDY